MHGRGKKAQRDVKGVREVCRSDGATAPLRQVISGNVSGTQAVKGPRLTRTVSRAAKTSRTTRRATLRGMAEVSKVPGRAPKIFLPVGYR